MDLGLTILVQRFYDKARGEEINCWIRAHTSKLDAYLLKKSKQFVHQGLLKSCKLNDDTARVEVVTLKDVKIILNKVIIIIKSGTLTIELHESSGNRIMDAF